jgi:hypothetical protein
MSFLADSIIQYLLKKLDNLKSLLNLCNNFLCFTGWWRIVAFLGMCWIQDNKISWCFSGRITLPASLSFSRRSFIQLWEDTSP